MNDLEVISINIWQILISLANLVILFFILKKFLFKPVKNIIAKREAEIGSEYDEVEKIKKETKLIKDSYELKMNNADMQADKIIKDSMVKSEKQSEAIICEALEKADFIVKKAQNDAIREQIEARESMKQEIVNVSAAISEQIIGREINMQDHQNIIDSFIEELEED